ncbi:cisd-3.2 [Pristionchus pacificus]|uniref:Cisd-3.2 n=1 Tax=Pristionchus pacificus TaxID=54126 RepID=A0A454XYR4_PRIPA|nr:cisd-3.2 [Pristionchus pacificus]|eukprot:PDM76413.1 cisd-3.2 [Pristionchus pacificus]
MASRLAARSTALLQQTRAKATGVTIKNPSADFLPYKGVDHIKKNVRVELQAGKTYAWCACGLSKTQPFCDGTHNLPGITNTRPVLFEVAKTATYSMCGCKQTDSRPLCDGSHKDVPKRPRSADAADRVVFVDASPVYDGVAHKLGYRVKNDGFQK